MITEARLNHGFTLVEMALVLLILGVLTRAAISPLAAVHEHRNVQGTARELDAIKDSLIAYVIAHGALPCPLSESGPVNLPVSGLNTPSSALVDKASDCGIERGGVPAKILGLAGRLNDKGALVDLWNRPYLYSVSLSNNSERGNQSVADWTQAGEAAQVGVPYLSADIVICMRMLPSDCSGSDIRANQVAFLVMSHGLDNSDAGAQRENLDNDQVFLLQAPSQVAENRFDDQLVWGTAADTMYWMLRMGWLP
ncbi:MAG: type II secretion system protein [Granulosicoccus sp.]